MGTHFQLILGLVLVLILNIIPTILIIGYSCNLILFLYLFQDAEIPFISGSGNNVTLSMNATHSCDCK